MLILTICSIFFLISYEYRVIYTETASKKKETEFKIKTIFEKNLTEKIKKSKQIVFSQSLHKKIIELLEVYIKKSNIKQNLMDYYEKFYGENLNLNIIPEESDVPINESILIKPQSKKIMKKNSLLDVKEKESPQMK